VNYIAAGIMKKFNAHKGERVWTLLNGRLFFTEAPERAELPYGVFFFISATPDYMFNKEKLDTFSVQFSLFDSTAGSSPIMSIYKEFIQTFDYAEIDLDEYRLLKMERVMSSINRDPEEAVWHAIIEYNIEVEDD